jgi:uncharacterized membrane protein YfhO
VDSDAFARALLADPHYTPRDTVILHEPLAFALETTGSGTTTVTQFAPEEITVSVQTDTPAIVSLAHPHYPGWQATLDGVTTPLERAYGGFSAVAVPAGQHSLTLAYRPVSFRVGLWLSLITWVSIAAYSILEIFIRRNDAR